MRSAWRVDGLWQGYYENRYVLPFRLPGALNKGEGSLDVNMAWYIDEYDGSETAFFLTMYIDTDEEGGASRLTEVTWQKFRDRSGSHFRPIPEDLLLIRNDIEKICILLDKCTISRGDRALPSILAAADREKPVRAGYAYHHHTNDYVLFIGPDQKFVRLRKTLVQDILELAFTDTTLLRDEARLGSLPGIASAHSIPLLLCLFSIVDSQAEGALKQLLPHEEISRLIEEDAEKQRQHTLETEKIKAEAEKKRAEEEAAKQKAWKPVSTEDFAKEYDAFLRHETFIPEILAALKNLEMPVSVRAAQCIVGFLHQIENEFIWPLLAFREFDRVVSANDPAVSYSFVESILAHRYYAAFGRVMADDEFVKEKAIAWLRERKEEWAAEILAKYARN